MRKTVAEFFAGIGLMRMGLDKAGWDTVWANNIDPDKLEIYSGHFPDTDSTYVLADVHDISATEFPHVGLATASFPCNDLSLAGSRNGLVGQHSSAFWGFIDVLKAAGSKRPEMVLLENVSGFLTSNYGNDFKDACLALNDLGYDVDAFIIDAARFVPQSRVRLFVVGTTKSQPGSRINETPSFLESQIRPKTLADFILWNPDIRWNIRTMPSLPSAEKRLDNIIENLPHNSSFWWSKERCEYLLNQMSEKHRRIANEMIEGKKTSCGTVFRRVRNGRSMAELRTDGIAGCLRTPRGGSGRQILFVAGRGKYRVRLLTPRECARLMGADNFSLSDKLTLNKALFGFGDAVCVPVISWIATNYLNPIWEDINSKVPNNGKVTKRVRYATR